MKNDLSDISLTEKNLTEYLTNFTNDLDEIINNIKSNSDNNIDNIKTQLINKTKDIINNLLSRINSLEKENSEIQKKFEKYKTNGEKKKHFLENQIKNVYKKDNEKAKQIKNKNKEISKLKADLLNLQNEYNNEINKQKSDFENLNINYEILEKKHKKIECEISELKDLNIKYEETICELEKENNELNDLLIENQNEIKNNDIKYQKKLEEMHNEIIDLNNELDEREQDFQKYKNKYEKELKYNEKLENKIQELINNKGEDNEYLTQYEIKKLKIPNRINTERNKNPKKEIEKVEKKFRYLYRTIENLNSRNQSKNSHNSAVSNKEKNILNNLVDNDINNKNKMTTIKTGLYRNNTSTGFKKLLNMYKNNNSNKKEENNNDIMDENSTNINSNSSIKLTPENYSFIKLYQLNNKLKWCLFKKNKNKTKSHIRGYSTGNELVNSDLDLYNYSDFIWVPYKTRKDFPEFREISSFVDSYEIKMDKREEVEDLKISIKNLENVILEKDKENTKLNNALSNLIMENKKFKNYNEKLKEENYKMKCEIKPDKNFIGVSFIADDPESSKFLDDKCCEDILIGLDKNPTRNNSKKNCCYSESLKNSIDMLMSKVIKSEDTNILMANILRQLGCSSEDIYKLIGNHRGVISIPLNKNK